MADNRRTVGQIEIIALSDRSSEQASAGVFPDVPAAAWERFKEAGASADSVFTMNFGCYVLRAPNLTLLVDTGVGGDILQELQSTGVGVGDVQAIFYTHLHGDHIAANLSGPEDNLQPTFPNARYYVPRGDWAYFVEEGSAGYNARVHDKFRVLQERNLIELVDEGFSISPEFTVFETPGHTPGHSCIAVTSGDAHAVIVGDAIIHPIQVGHPEWNSTWDSDAATATDSRRKLVQRMAQENALGGVSHFAAPGFGKVIQSEGQLDWENG